MSIEPETDNVQDGPWTPREWADWVLMGDAVRVIPKPLEGLHARIVQAIVSHARNVSKYMTELHKENNDLRTELNTLKEK